MTLSELLHHGKNHVVGVSIKGGDCIVKYRVNGGIVTGATVETCGCSQCVFADDVGLPQPYCKMRRKVDKILKGEEENDE